MVVSHDSARFTVRLSKRKTVDGIWFLILIAYVYTADTCLILLRCVQVHEPVEFKGKRVKWCAFLKMTIVKLSLSIQVYYFDGELECFNGKHLPYGVIAIIISVVVLLSIPVYVLAITFNFIKVCMRLECITTEFSLSCSYTQKGGPLRDVISSGIKKQYHWWSGYDLLRRLLFFIVYLFCENFASNYTQVKPYKSLANF